MACTIGEYPSGPMNGMQAVKGSTRIVTQVLSVGAVQTSQPFTQSTKSVRVWSDTKMAFRFGPATQAPPTALITDEGWTAGATEYFTVDPGDYLSVIGIP